MFFASDNGGPAHPRVIEAVQAANTGHAMPYGNDPLTQSVCDDIRTLFEAPDAEVFLVATGSAANALALSAYTQPFQTIYCTPMAHIAVDECGAPEFYTGGGKLSLVPGGDKMDPDALRATIQATAQGVVHGVQRGPVSLTQVTECGGVYTLEELGRLVQTAKGFDLPVHLDGARFANALAATNASPADMSWRFGIDVLALGGTKNGCLGVEAVVFFDPQKAWEFQLRRKRGGHLFSKSRFLAAQMSGYLSDGLWLETARTANSKAARLAKGLEDAGARLDHPVDANMIFASLPRQAHQRLHDAGAQYYLMAELEGADPDAFLPCRLVCDWSVEDAALDAFLDAVRG
jgi:threonine aldolase